MSRLNSNLQDLVIALADNQEIKKDNLSFQTAYYEEQYAFNKSFESLLAFVAYLLFEGII